MLLSIIYLQRSQNQNEMPSQKGELNTMIVGACIGAVTIEKPYGSFSELRLCKM